MTHDASSKPDEEVPLSDILLILFCCSLPLAILIGAMILASR